MLVIRVELTDVFNKLLDWNCFHIICRKKEIFRVAICLTSKTSTFTFSTANLVKKAFTPYHVVLSSQDHS